MRKKKIISTLIPLFLFIISLKYVNAENVSYLSSGYFTAGSTVLIHYYNNDFDFTLPVGKIYMYYELYDANGNEVYKWIKEPKYYEYTTTHQYAEDWFKFKIPNMMGMLLFDDRPEGEWTLKASVHDSTGDVDYSSIINYKFTVYRGNFFDNLFAPIYIYKGYHVFGIEIVNFHAILPPIGYIILPLLIVIALILLIKYLRFSAKEMKNFISLSKYKISKEWKMGEENERKNI